MQHWICVTMLNDFYLGIMVWFYMRLRRGVSRKEAFVIDADGNVTLNINNKKPGLYYGVQVLAELGADPVVTVSETENGLVVPAEDLPEGNAAFFRVVVDFNPIVVPEAE